MKQLAELTKRLKRQRTALLSGVILNAVALPLWAQEADAPTATVDIAGHSVPVEAGGLYHRFHSNPPLSVIAAEAPDIDLSWFRSLQKTKVDMGFESYSPNFYYRNTRVTAVFTADLQRLRELMPAEVLEQVQPLQIWPGRGLVAFTAYAYHYCDNDSYNEIALSIVTNKPGNANLGPISLVGQSLSKDLWGYVLKLPVNTELARVRGVVGYNLPKWLTPIDYRETEQSLVFEIADSETGKLDVTFEVEKLADVSNEPELVTNSFTNIGHNGELAYGYAVSRQMSHASNSNADSVNLKLGDGSLSAYIESLKLGKMMKYEYVPDFQSALYAPEPLAQMLDQE
ncbi:acetoacetate decarboxylase (ADC) [Stutzerimonas stutzeri]|uniref:acetoacetate decarboxylase (ADC) n=1 Tax=Stutzerimonas stutzeri TaxID=316 RepID=UPI001CFD394A|nr:acetoacetate decarboxylase (ADC) [Stutzerimonas stutzeri]|tara:strand:- start:6757 stop:7782 length:1026 start_codon:yes stop_codon:yes gene_type:complete